MIALVIGYGLLALYTLFIVVISAALWGMMGLGFLIYRNEDHTVDADWRPVAIGIMVVAGIAQWFLLKSADTIIRTMWNSLPPLAG